jgi:hypothetical protein
MLARKRCIDILPAHSSPAIRFSEIKKKGQAPASLGLTTRGRRLRLVKSQYKVVKRIKNWQEIFTKNNLKKRNQVSSFFLHHRWPKFRVVALAAARRRGRRRCAVEAIGSGSYHPERDASTASL